MNDVRHRWTRACRSPVALMPTAVHCKSVTSNKITSAFVTQKKTTVWTARMVCDRQWNEGKRFLLHRFPFLVVPNPCVTESDQFFPFAYSQRAYIQCDGELLFIQPCGPLLYWNQEEKICDRKRPSNVKSKTTTPKPKAKASVPYEIVDDDSNEEGISTTTEQPT